MIVRSGPGEVIEEVSRNIQGTLGKRVSGGLTRKGLTFRLTQLESNFVKSSKCNENPTSSRRNSIEDV